MDNGYHYVGGWKKTKTPGKANVDDFNKNKVKNYALK